MPATVRSDSRGRRARAAYQRLPPLVRRPLVAAAGAALLVAGLVLLVLPGPGLLVLAAGLAVLAVEFHWARRLLARVRAHAQAAAQKAGQKVPTRRR